MAFAVSWFCYPLGQPSASRDNSASLCLARSRQGGPLTPGDCLRSWGAACLAMWTRGHRERNCVGLARFAPQPAYNRSFYPAAPARRKASPQSPSHDCESLGLPSRTMKEAEASWICRASRRSGLFHSPKPTGHICASANFTADPIHLLYRASPPSLHHHPITHFSPCLFEPASSTLFLCRRDVGANRSPP
jgi:hypothetical protein